MKVKDHKGVEFDTLKAMCAFYGISVRIYHWRLNRGLSLEEALAPTKFVCHKGIKFPNVQAMCDHYGVTVRTYQRRRQEGKSLKESLEGYRWYKNKNTGVNRELKKLTWVWEGATG